MQALRPPPARAGCPNQPLERELTVHPATGQAQGGLDGSRPQPAGGVVDVARVVTDLTCVRICGIEVVPLVLDEREHRERRGSLGAVLPSARLRQLRRVACDARGASEMTADQLHPCHPAESDELGIWY